MTNTQPDYSRVGNSEVLDLTVGSHNWIGVTLSSLRASRSKLLVIDRLGSSQRSNREFQ